MAYLDDHPPARSQFRCPRRAEPSGVIVVHTAESAPDFKPPDTGAEAVAAFIADRSDKPGSYHDVCDSDSIVHLVRYGCEAFHVGTYNTNWHAYGVSAAARADDWQHYPSSWVAGVTTQMANACRQYAAWLHARRGIWVPPRRITVSQCRAGVPGFISHGELDPTRRHDPGITFPWAQFLRYYQGSGPSPAPIPTPPPSGGLGTVPVNLRVLKEGMSGGDVKSLQALLVDKAGQGGTLQAGAAGSSHAGVDGKFGPRTSTAVRNIQAFFGLKSDGIVGVTTWPVLFV
jgi:hypothetical protein